MFVRIKNSREKFWKNERLKRELMTAKPRTLSKILEIDVEISYKIWGLSKHISQILALVIASQKLKSYFLKSWFCGTGYIKVLSVVVDSILITKTCLNIE